MKRDMSLIRKLLEYVEAQTDGRYHDAPGCLDFAQESVHYHIGLCGQAGFLEVRKISGGEEPLARYELRNLTWAGHESLDRLRLGYDLK